ncbi:MAG: hypothetical protein V9E83_01975 [Baekduia sp.]
MRRSAIVPAVVIALLGAAGCGSGDDGGPLTRAEATAQANAICRAATAKINAYVEGTQAPSAPEETQAALRQDVLVARAASTALSELAVPADGRADFERFATGVSDFADANQTFVSAIDAKDRRGVQAGSRDAVAAGKEAEKGAKAYGLADCPPPTTATAFADKDAASAPSVDPVGRWTGEVLQTNADGKQYRYSATMTVAFVGERGVVSGTVRYPSFPCGGDIVYLRTDVDRFYFRERITSNESKCPSGGRIRATVRGDEMAWRWTRGTIAVAGILKRR